MPYVVIAVTAFVVTVAFVNWLWWLNQVSDEDGCEYDDLVGQLEYADDEIRNVLDVLEGHTVIRHDPKKQIATAIKSLNALLPLPRKEN